jgi:hypothetical protein
MPIDWTRVIKAEPPAPPSLTPRQIRLGLYAVGITEDTIDGYLQGDPASHIEWKFASQYERDHPLVAAIADELELSPEQVDALWEWAAEL